MPARSAQVTPGTSNRRPQSAILVPVAAAEEIVGRWRDCAGSLAPPGVPAHVTLIVPWLPPEQIGVADIAELGRCLSGVQAFDFVLTKVCRFGRRVVWAAPEPAEVFRSLTMALAEEFGTPPWENEFDEVVPHLTVAHIADDGNDLEAVEREVTRCLPLTCQASEVWVMVGDGRRWTVEAKVPLLRGAAEPGSVAARAGVPDPGTLAGRPAAEPGSVATRAGVPDPATVPARAGAAGRSLIRDGIVPADPARSHPGVAGARRSR